MLITVDYNVTIENIQSWKVLKELMQHARLTEVVSKITYTGDSITLEIDGDILEDYFFDWDECIEKITQIVGGCCNE